MKKLKFWSMILLMAMSLPLMVSCGGDDSDDESSVPPSEYPENPDPYDVMNFKDIQVAAICVENFDLNKDGKISYAEAAAVKDLGKAFEKSNTQKNLLPEMSGRFFIRLIQKNQNIWFSSSMPSICTSK